MTVLFPINLANFFLHQISSVGDCVATKTAADRIRGEGLGHPDRTAGCHLPGQSVVKAHLEKNGALSSRG